MSYDFDTRVFGGGPVPDGRLSADRHTNSVFPITRFFTRAEVEARQKELRYNLLMAAGLVPFPEKTPLNVRRERIGTYDGFSVEKIMFETRPGFWSTGNLYLPDPLPKKAPAIFNVIGHWMDQRLTRLEAADYPQQFANFAKMGFIALATDMIGTVDSRQITHAYGGGEKELYLSNGLGVQLWNNIRALDLLCSMPEVDETKIGVTGASGGGSQTLFLALADDRVRAAAPINMISLRMQGGCDCENAPGLRRGTDNCEMCAMLAPRPLFLAGSTGDWTCEQETKEIDGILEAYRPFGAEDKVEHYYQVAPHQYNARTRKRVYNFFARHLMGKDIEWEEVPVDFTDSADLTWFRGEGHAPGVEGDEEFFETFKVERTKSVAALPAEEKRRMLAWMTGIRAACAIPADGFKEYRDGITCEKSVLLSDGGKMIPFVRLTPDFWDGRRCCLALGGEGKAVVNSPEIKAMLEDGIAVVSGDLFLTGEYGDARVRVAGDGQGQKYFTTFHYTADAYRAADTALLWTLLEGEDKYLYAEGPSARAAACALPLLKGVSRATLDKAALALRSDAELMEKCFIPGIGLLGGIEGCLRLAGCEIETF